MPPWTPNTELSGADTEPILPDGTTLFLWQMIEKQHPDLRCSLRACREPAFLALQTPNGCVVESDDKWQAACQAHLVSDGFKTGADRILDLTVGEALSGGGLPLHLGYSALELQQFLLGRGEDATPPPDLRIQI